jgi:GNAT superfamily N-acetyltransferase
VEPEVTGPHLIREVHWDLAYQLGNLWLAVTRAGGAVDFPPDGPELDVRVAANLEVVEVAAGRAHLLALGQGDEMVGTVFVVPGKLAISRHRAEVRRLMVAPRLQGRGCGGRLLDAAVAHARSMRMERLRLSCRSGTGLPEFYAAQGWTEVGRWPDGLLIAPGDYRDEVLFQREL